MFTQVIKALHMTEQGSSSDRQNGHLLLIPFSTIITAKWELLDLTQKNTFFRGFILKPTEKT